MSASSPPQRTRQTAPRAPRRDGPAPRVFLLSPANLSGARGRRILARSSDAPFMDALRDGRGVPVGEVYAFVSSLYYRGKREYARAFGRRRAGACVLTVTATRGLVPDDEPVDLDTLTAFAASEIDAANRAYVRALDRSARALHEALGGRGDVVLLGSIATEKYVGPLTDVFGSRLLFPRDFIGRGDMSRGGLLLRHVSSGRELEYVTAVGAPRRGPRPPRLPPRPGA